VKVYLDEMISPRVAVALRDRHHDATATAEHQALGAADTTQFALAIREQRTFVTYNIGDFVILARAASTAGRDHWGLVLVHERRLPPSDIGGLIEALHRLMSQRPESNPTTRSFS
jgi:predicted nuclease of predicted toxin-antitoxin system